MAANTIQIMLDQQHVLLVEPSSIKQRFVMGHLKSYGVMAIHAFNNGADALASLDPHIHHQANSSMAFARYDRDRIMLNLQ